MRSFYDITSGAARFLFGGKFRPFETQRVSEPFFKLKVNDLNRGSYRNFSTGGQSNIKQEWLNYRETSKKLLTSGLNSSRYSYDVNSLTKLPKSYESHLQDDVKFSKCLGMNPLFTHYVNPLSIVSFAAKYLLSYRFLFIYMARTTFQAVRPLLAFCVFGEIMKLILANLSGGVPAYLFSFVLAFEVLYFFLQCYISYTFLMMFFTVMF
ncbi:conserved hypothetical protein [Theileria equi strain WA]|uniref:Uncharacterized protein n=1 Tax=Theileria equi strain WA TaxID=1537102 RepID=L1LG22_THEEQ|nr:conserved hypothetical protein [Theileria equi strain WA]EKX74108.1 conserved hypothetical protein [Theileria equi strain WA]|eukprot:XP_004833560.1 conserved hypothetical protein [Theileria equi strain WA]